MTMTYGFPQITNKKAVELLTSWEHNSKFSLIPSTNGRNFSLQRNLDLEQVDYDLTHEVFDSRMIFTEITNQNHVKTDVDQSLEFLKFFRSKLKNLARKYGYPNQSFDKNNATEFSHKMATLIWELMNDVNMSPVDAASPGIWNFLQTVGCPSVACWRWEKDQKTVLNRLIGNKRGAFAVAWWRYAVFTNFGEYEYEDWIYKLTEDAIQGVLERPGMRGYTPVIIPFIKRIAQIIDSGQVDSVKYIRTASIQLRIKSSTVNFWYLIEDGVNPEKIVDEVFDTTDLLLAQ